MDGKTFATLDEGMAYVRGSRSTRSSSAASARWPISRTRSCMRECRSVSCLRKMLAQTRPGARGALLLHGCLPPSEFGGWPAGVSAQIHTMDADEYGDVDVAREFAASVADVELFEYPGDRHLFTDPSLDDYDEAAATQVRDRSRVPERNRIAQRNARSDSHVVRPDNAVRVQIGGSTPTQGHWSPARFHPELNVRGRYDGPVIAVPARQETSPPRRRLQRRCERMRSASSISARAKLAPRQ